MYTYCLILRWDSFKQYWVYIEFISYIVYIGLIFLVCKFEKEKETLKKRYAGFTLSLDVARPGNQRF